MLVNGLNRRNARSHATRATSFLAGLWRQIRALVDDIGAESVLVRKVKAHATWKDVEAGASTAWQRRGG